MGPHAVNFAAQTTSSLSTAFSGIQSQIMSGLEVIAPIAVAILGIFLVWKYGVSFFKSVAGK